MQGLATVAFIIVMLVSHLLCCSCARLAHISADPCSVLTPPKRTALPSRTSLGRSVCCDAAHADKSVVQVYVCSEFRGPLVHPIPDYLLGNNEIGLASIAVMPISLSCASVFRCARCHLAHNRVTKSLWQRNVFVGRSSQAAAALLHGQSSSSAIQCSLGLSSRPSGCPAPLPSGELQQIEQTEGDTALCALCGAWLQQSRHSQVVCAPHCPDTQLAQLEC